MNPIREGAKNLPGHWHKGSMRDGKGNFCGLGHVQNVLINDKIEFGKAWAIMNQVAHEQYPDRISENDLGPCAFAEFNDHPDTTEAEVVTVMEKAAVRLDEEL